MPNNTTFSILNIRVTNVNVKNPPWSKTDRCFHYKIQLTNNITKYSIYADYYGSFNDFINNKSELTADELIGAAQMIIRDALYARDYTLEQFLEEFCYLESGQAKLDDGIQVYRKCSQLLNDLIAIFTPDQLDKLTEELYDWENDED
jgi:hypothetical protein